MSTVLFCALTLAGIFTTGSQRRGLFDIYDGETLLPLLRCLTGFIIGIVTQRIATVPLVRRWIRLDLVGDFSSVLVCVAIVVGMPDYLIYLLFPLVIFGLSADRGYVASLLATRTVYTLGVFSYALYVVHVPVIVLLNRYIDLLDPWLKGVSGSVLLLLAYLIPIGTLTCLVHYILEMPASHYFRRIALMVRSSPP